MYIVFLARLCPNGAQSPEATKIWFGATEKNYWSPGRALLSIDNSVTPEGENLRYQGLAEKISFHRAFDSLVHA